MRVSLGLCVYLATQDLFVFNGNTIYCLIGSRGGRVYVLKLLTRVYGMFADACPDSFFLFSFSPDALSVQLFCPKFTLMVDNHPSVVDILYSLSGGRGD